MAKFYRNKVMGDAYLHIEAAPLNFEFDARKNGIILSNESSVILTWDEVQELANWLLAQKALVDIKRDVI